MPGAAASPIPPGSTMLVRTNVRSRLGAALQHGARANSECADRQCADQVRADHQLEDSQRADHRGVDDGCAQD